MLQNVIENKLVYIHTFHPTFSKEGYNFPKMGYMGGYKKVNKMGTVAKKGIVIRREGREIFEKENRFPHL